MALLAAFAFVGSSAASASADSTGSISGTVVGAGDPGAPLADVDVSLSLPGGSPVQNNTSTASDGTYSFVGLPAAGYIIQYHPPFDVDYSPLARNNEPLTGTPDVVNLANGQSYMANVTHSTAVGVNGDYTVIGLAPGSYQVEFLLQSVLHTRMCGGTTSRA